MKRITISIESQKISVAIKNRQLMAQSFLEGFNSDLESDSEYLPFLDAVSRVRSYTMTFGARVAESVIHYGKMTEKQALAIVNSMIEFSDDFKKTLGLLPSECYEFPYQHYVSE